MDTINGIDLVLAVIAAAGWTAWKIERTSPKPPRRVKPDYDVYDWRRQGL